MAFLGMDVDQATTEHGNLVRLIADLQTAQKNIDMLVARLVPGIWKGNDANSFSSLWTGTHNGQLNTIHTNLTAFATQLKTDISEQTTASS